MNDATRKAIIDAATAKATRLCAAAITSLAQGRSEWRKGKKIVVPYSENERAARKRLQIDAFTAGVTGYGLDYDVVPIIAPHYTAEGVTTDTAELALLDEARALYRATGVAEVERLFSA